jgi:hypothetical protein
MVPTSVTWEWGYGAAGFEFHDAADADDGLAVAAGGHASAAFASCGGHPFEASDRRSAIELPEEVLALDVP